MSDTEQRSRSEFPTSGWPTIHPQPSLRRASSDLPRFGLYSLKGSRTSFRGQRGPVVRGVRIEWGCAHRRLVAYQTLGLSPDETREARFQNRAPGLLSLQLSVNLLSAIPIAFQVKLCEDGMEPL